MTQGPNGARATAAMKTALRDAPENARRRRLALIPVALCCSPRLAIADAPPSHRRWMAAAEEMKSRALSWGDQAYGAVLVKDDRVIGLGPSRVVKNQDADAHAEREAIKHALASVGRQGVAGAVLYSTSRPCALCESAAFKAGVSRMIHGPTLQDVGAPVGR